MWYASEHVHVVPLDIRSTIISRNLPDKSSAHCECVFRKLFTVELHEEHAGNVFLCGGSIRRGYLQFGC